MNTSLLIIHQGALGDVVLTFPALIALRKQFDRIDILCQGQIGKLAAKLGQVDTAYPLEAAYFATLFSDQVDAKIKDLISNYIKILVFSFSSDLENTINQISDRACLRIPPRPPAPDGIHVAEYVIQHLISGNLLKATDLKNAESDWQKKRARKDHPIDISKIILHPGSGSIRKRWPLDRFLKLAHVLEKNGLQPQFVCGPAEPDLIAEIQNQKRPLQTFSELTDLVDGLEAAGAYIGNDSGVSHLAAYLGLPSVVIFGPADPKRWRPVGPRVQIVRPALACSPCFEVENANCAQPACLTDTPLESVVEAFDQVYQG